MHIVVAMDSFKGSLSSMEAGQAVRAGIAQADPSVSVTVRPLADGGEGTVEALISGLGGQWQQVTVTGPLGAPVVCSYGILPATGTAVVEMSGAAGLTLVPKSQRNPLYTTTYGVGELLLAAKEAGYEAAVCFVVQMGEVRWMEPNDRTHPEFGEALRRAARAGVQVLALDCDVRPDRLDIAGPVEVRL